MKYIKGKNEKKRNQIILGAYFFLRHGNLIEIPVRTNQPKEPNAGSIFRNPPNIPAGFLIDELGLKGTQIGGAAISELHANFIVNRGGATCVDVIKLIKLVQKKVRAAYGINLKTEIEILENK